jgi:hypothetical protein
MSTLKLATRQWQRIRAELHKEHPKSVFMIKNRMKSVLGFTVRVHNGYRMRTAKELAEYDMSDHELWDTVNDSKFHRLHTMDCFIALDFYDERKYTMFLLKYSEFL